MMPSIWAWRQRRKQGDAQYQKNPALHMPLQESTTSVRRILSFWFMMPNHEAWELRPAAARREHSVGSTSQERPTVDVDDEGGRKRSRHEEASFSSSCSVSSETRKRPESAHARTPRSGAQSSPPLPPSASPSLASPPLSPPQLLHLFRRQESHFQEEVDRPNDDTVRRGSTSGSHVTDRGCSHLLLGHLLKRLRPHPCPVRLLSP